MEQLEESRRKACAFFMHSYSIIAYPAAHVDHRSSQALARIFAGLYATVADGAAQKVWREPSARGVSCTVTGYGAEHHHGCLLASAGRRAA